MSRTERRRVLLIVDREPFRLMLLADRLRADGFDVDAAATPERVIEALEERPADLAIIGPSITGGEEATVAGWIRSRVTAPILHLREGGDGDERSRRDTPSLSVTNRTLVAPFTHAELLNLIDEMLAPTARHRPPRHGSIVLDLDAGRVHVGGRAIRVSPLEARLLASLAAVDGKSVPTPQLLAQVWPDDRNPEPTSIWILVWRLRQKIEADPKRPRLLVSVPGAGYRLEMREV